MATINATLSVSSDITSGLNISKNMALNKADAERGLELTSGLVKRSFTSTNQVDLIASGAQNYGTPTAVKSAKIYIRNVSNRKNGLANYYPSDPLKHFKIGKGTASGSADATPMVGNASTYWEMGRLYSGDWMLIPWDAAASQPGDITIQPSVATTMIVEYIVFFE